MEPILTIFDSQICLPKIASQKASILLRWDGCSVIITDHSNTVLGIADFGFETPLASETNPNLYESYANELKKLFQEEELFNYPYETIEIAFEGFRNTLVPLPFYSEEKQHKILSLTHHLSVYDKIFVDMLPDLTTANVFAIPAPIVSVVSTTFPESKFSSLSTVFIKSFLEQSANDQTNVFVNCAKNFIQICVIRDRKLVLFNSFRYQTDSDFLYFVVFVAEQLGILSDENARGFLMGSTEKFADNSMEILREYIPDLTFSEIPEHKIGFPEKFSTPHYYPLYLLSRCE